MSLCDQNNQKPMNSDSLETNFCMTDCCKISKIKLALVASYSLKQPI
ncbi:MAG: hypothetical protein LUQ18_09160 [Methylococcaceae bacterium]|nr:hypothetical protein [Methylococcaceae bacterium]